MSNKATTAADAYIPCMGSRSVKRTYPITEFPHADSSPGLHTTTQPLLQQADGASHQPHALPASAARRGAPSLSPRRPDRQTAGSDAPAPPARFALHARLPRSPRPLVHAPPTRAHAVPALPALPARLRSRLPGDGLGPRPRGPGPHPRAFPLSHSHPRANSNSNRL
ncbi:hypothetical protein WOLCODRAFT_26948 [Wolfiporia cocos MD-104 SS10]|uniref:Uncharacterized protein n=1 Tax=Wolfiporia cocos (strain MD-104) TaxID=742152 RepID=A0A2H3K6K4_WOLCO|nr:hypothetical protein WOLCODRAFT_26948 [Wolfiporia cocos MD-104 SS10]